MSAGWLLERMGHERGSAAIIWDDQTFTYGDMLERINRWRLELDEHGVSSGHVVALECDYSLDTCALVLALVERGAVVVPMTSTEAAKRDDRLQIAEVGSVVVIDRAERWRFEQRRVDVTHPLTRRLVDAGLPGLVLFTSGSTGRSKAALHNFTALLENNRPLRRRLRTLAFYLLDHIGGINTLLYTLANCGTLVIARSRDVAVVCEAIERHRVQYLPTTPTFLNLLRISEAYKNYDLSSIELVSYGTEVMPESTLRRLGEMFPHARIQHAYGLSEIGILRSKSKGPESVWLKPEGEGFETRVVNGVLWIRARSAMLGYLNAPSPFDADGWMNTEDEVEVEGDYVRILGRRSEIINVGGQKVHPAEVENTLLEMPNVSEVVVHGEPNAITGSIVVARISLREPEELQALKKRVRAFCSTRLAPYKVPVKVEIVDKLPYSDRYKKLRQE